MPISGALGKQLPSKSYSCRTKGCLGDSGGWVWVSVSCPHAPIPALPRLVWVHKAGEIEVIGEKGEALGGQTWAG